MFASTGVLEIKSVDVGVVAIRSLSSNFYLAISWRGEVYGSVSVHQAYIHTALKRSQPARRRWWWLSLLRLWADVMGVVAATGVRVGVRAPLSLLPHSQPGNIIRHSAPLP